MAFDALKAALVSATSLAFPSPHPHICILDTDASDVAIGAVLTQTVEGTERPIAFFRRIFNETQRNYCTTRRELLAVIAALQHFRHYLLAWHDKGRSPLVPTLPGLRQKPWTTHQKSWKIT